MGSLEGNSATFVSVPATLIDWSRPASANGTVNTASVAWVGASTPCDGIFYVRFYAIPSNAFAIVMSAERGPFRAVNGINTVTLEPPVLVNTDTYIGIRRGSGPESCGKPFGTFTREEGHVLYTGDDFKSGAFTSLSPATHFRLQAMAANVSSVRVSTVPVVGSVAGALGSNFRTSLSMSNPSTFESRGKLVFHPSGRAAADGDPSLDFVIPPSGTLNYADLIASMGQSGVGSLDVLTTASPTPIVSARVFNDAGTAGTSGLTEDAVPAGASYLSLANIFIPTDLANYRLNIGIRTFTAGDVNVSVYDAAGALQSSTVRNYVANFFEQIPGAIFTGGALPPGGRIVVSAFQKDFIVYGSVTDNRTNDPNLRIGLD